MRHHIIYLLAVVAMGLASCAAPRSIEVDRTESDGARLRMTSANSIFSGCELRVCQYTPQGKNPVYGICLDIQDRIIHASAGDLLTIYMKDGNRVQLKNLYNAQSEVHEHVENELETEVYTDYVPVYSAWHDAIVAAPVTRTYQYTRPVVREDSWVRLYYMMTPDQMSQVAEGKVDHIELVTDRETIVRRAHRISRAIRNLQTLFL